MYNPPKAPSQLTSGILILLVATGGLRILGVIVRMPKKSPSEAYMFLLKKNYHNNIDTDLDFRGKSIKDVLLYDLVFRILHAHLRLNYIYLSLALTVLNEFNVPPQLCFIRHGLRLFTHCIYTHLVKNMFYLKFYLYIYEVHVTVYTCLIFVQRSIVYNTHIIYACACSFDSFINQLWSFYMYIDRHISITRHRSFSFYFITFFSFKKKIYAFYFITLSFTI